MEACKAFHYRWCDWQMERPMWRAKMIAHEHEHLMREAYNAEKMREAAKREPEKEKGKGPSDRVREMFFGSGE